jgi:hypothetical protein
MINFQFKPNGMTGLSGLIATLTVEEEKEEERGPANNPKMEEAFAMGPQEKQMPAMPRGNVQVLRT